MGTIAILLLFVVLFAFPGFYILNRKIWAHHSKKFTAWLSVSMTLLLVLMLLLGMQGLL